GVITPVSSLLSFTQTLADASAVSSRPSIGGAPFLPSGGAGLGLRSNRLVSRQAAAQPRIASQAGAAAAELIVTFKPEARMGSVSARGMTVASGRPLHPVL